MKGDDKNKIEEATEGSISYDDFAYYNLGLEIDWKARDVELEAFIICHRENPSQCPYSISDAGSWYCSYPPVIHISGRLCPRN